MKKNKQMFRKQLLMLFSILFFISCSEEEKATDSIGEVTTEFQFSSQYSELSDTNKPLPLSCYLFNGQMLYKVIPNITLDSQNRATISALVGSSCYFISGFQIDATETRTTLQEFLSKNVGNVQAHTASAPLFASAFHRVGFNSEVFIPLKRGVARLDLNTTADSRTKITSVLVRNAPASTLPFSEGTGYVSPVQKKYEHIFTTPVSGNLEELLYLYESNRPVDITVYGTYNDSPIAVDLTIPSVSRNKIYMLEILNAGATFTGVFNTLPWETGDTISGKPNTGQKIQINPALSSIPYETTVDNVNGIVYIPDLGTKMTLAFVGGSELSLALLDGPQADIKVTKSDVRSTSEGVVTKFDVTVSPQTKGQSGYSATMHLKSVLSEHTYDYVKLNIAPSRYQIETVRMGGLDWMAYNSRGASLEDQVYKLEDISVEQMYITNWIGCVGNLFQFGRKYAYTSWVGYNPSNNLGGQSANAPWTALTHSPCPEGFRVPTRDELQALLVNTQVIPGTYLYKGEEINATIHAISGAPITPTSVGGSQRYVKLTSKSSGKYLILPAAGYKTDKATGANPQFGRWGMFWSNSNAGAWGGHAWVCGLDVATDSSAKMTNSQIPAEAFSSVRCVKK